MESLLEVALYFPVYWLARESWQQGQSHQSQPLALLRRLGG